MIPVKSGRQLEIMREGGKRLARVFRCVLEEVKAGARLNDLDLLAEKLIEKQGGRPSFKGVKGYHWTTCININQGVVHGIPNEYKVLSGDVLSLDMGMLFEGYHTDMARTVRVGNKSENRISEFVKVGEKTLKAAVKKARVGKHVGHISLAIERQMKQAGFNPIESLTGHGIGRRLHEEPQIPGLLKQKISDTPCLKENMTLAIEVIYAEGKADLVSKEDGWTIETADGRLAGLFEDTVAITKAGPLVLTPLDLKLNV